MSTVGPLRLTPGHFFGGARLSYRRHGVEVSHRIAEGAPDAVPTHTHTDAHFILVSGGDYVSAAGERPAGGQPVLVYNPPGTTHRDHFEGGRGSFFAISLEPQLAATALAGMGTADSPRYLLTPGQHALALRIARSATLEAEDLSVQGLCLELLGSMNERARSEEPRAMPAWLGLALQLLYDRYADDLRIAEIAASVGVHPVHLARTFRRHFRCTPGEFARYRRLESAVGLLSRTVMPLSEVALNSGFADQSHFTRTFARYFGLPPGQYRLLAGRRANPPSRFQIDKTHPPQWRRFSAWAAATVANARRRT